MVAYAMLATEVDIEVRYSRRTANPTAVPRATGNRMDAAGFAKRAAGSVREGMKVVMVRLSIAFS